MMKAIKLPISVLIGLSFLVLLSSLAAAPLDAPGCIQVTVEPHSTPTPSAPAQPTATPAPVTNIVSQIFHYITFPASTISEAIKSTINEAAEEEAESLIEQTEDWSKWLGDVVKSPEKGYYSTAAQISLPAAAALAPALFIFRLVLYHWNRLTGQDDSVMTVLGDWIIAGAAAAAAGPVLDLLARLGWWLATLILGDTTQLASAFVTAMKPDPASTFINATLFSGVFMLGLTLAGILAIVSLLFAFLATTAALYVMAILAAPLAVIGVIPQMRWMRGLWLKAVGLIAVIPVVAGGIFKAGTAAVAFTIPDGGLLSVIIRFLWLLGAAGFMLTLAGILSRVTLTAAADAGGALVGAVKSVVSVAATAMSAGASAGVSAGASAALAASGSSSSPDASAGGMIDGGGSSGSGGGGGGGGSGGSSGNGYSSALGHYQAAQTYNNRATWLDAFGLHAPAQFNRSLARNEELEARKNELYERQAALEARGTGGGWGGQWGGDSRRDQPAEGQEERSVETRMSEISRNLDLSRPVTTKMIAAHGNPENFEQGFNQLNTAVQQKGGTDLRLIAPGYPADVGRMVASYQTEPDRIENAEDPLREAAYQGHARGVLQALVDPADPTWGAMYPPQTQEVPADPTWGTTYPQTDALPPPEPED